MRTVWIFREKIENSSSGALVLHMTSNLTISRRCQDENGNEMYQNVKRTCRACRTTVFANSTYCYVAFSKTSLSLSPPSLLKVSIDDDDNRKLKHATLLSREQKPEVSCFLFQLVFIQPHLYY